MTARLFVAVRVVERATSAGLGAEFATLVVRWVARDFGGDPLFNRIHLAESRTVVAARSAGWWLQVLPQIAV